MKPEELMEIHGSSGIKKTETRTQLGITFVKILSEVEGPFPQIKVPTGLN